jgi:hypothetical protein
MSKAPQLTKITFKVLAKDSMYGKVWIFCCVVHFVLW